MESQSTNQMNEKEYVCDGPTNLKTCHPDSQHKQPLNQSIQLSDEQVPQNSILPENQQILGT